MIGVKEGDVDALEMDEGEFFSSITVETRLDNFQWEIINVYGPVQLERKGHFLQELTAKISSVSCPVVVGGDFNLIRYAWEKSTDNLDQGWMDAFNLFIDENGLKEMHRKRGKFTWTNKQAQL